MYLKVDTSIVMYSNRIHWGGFGSGSAFAGRGCQGRLESVGGRDWHLLSLSLTT